jgi:hypothetical protein
MVHFGLPIRMVLTALATWRITHLLASEDGPGDVFFHLRRKLGAGFLGRLMDCFYCLSLWVSAAAALLVCEGVADWILAWLGLSGAACLLEQATRREPAVHLQPEMRGESDYALLRPETRQPDATEPEHAAPCGAE